MILQRVFRYAICLLRLGIWGLVVSVWYMLDLSVTLFQSVFILFFHRPLREGLVFILCLFSMHTWFDQRDKPYLILSVYIANTAFLYYIQSEKYKDAV